MNSARKSGAGPAVLMALMLMLTAATALGDVKPPYSGSWLETEAGQHAFAIEYGASVNGKPYVQVFWNISDEAGNGVFMLGLDEQPDEHSAEIRFHAPYGITQVNAGVGTFLFAGEDEAIFDYVPSQWMMDVYGARAFTIPIGKQGLIE